MRAAVVAEPQHGVVEECRLPSAGPAEVLVRVEGCGVCGSSLPLWEGRPWFTYPLEAGTPGHEIWGRTSDDRRVTGLCQHGFAEYAVLREVDVIPLPPALDGLPFPGEAFGCAVNITRRADVRPGHDVAIVGMGFIGTVVAELCALGGAHVTPVRRGDSVIGAFERVIECAGTQAALDRASALVAPGGTLVIAGFHQDGPRTVDLQSWNWRGIDVVNAHERDPAVVRAGIETAIGLVEAGLLDVEHFVTHSFPLDALDEAFQAAARRGPGFLKAVVCP